MSTIQDVARHAGVSVSTVSNVLNGRAERMRKETLERVQSAIRELKFQPNRLAQQLKTGQTSLLGLLVPSMTNPMYGFMAREIEKFAQEMGGLRLLIGSTYRDREKESAFFDDLLAHGVRRVIVISSLADERHFETAVGNGMSVVSYDRGATPGRRSRVAHVMPDNQLAAQLATRHLIEHGHARLAFTTVAGLTMSRSAKIQGFTAAAEHARVHGEVLDGGPLNEYGETVIAQVGRATAHQIARMRERPTGVVALNDLMAMGLMAGLRECGLAVPQDVSVVGIDGMPVAGLTNPALTTVCLPVREMAQAMVARALNRERGRKDVVFAPSLLRRESVAAPPTRQRSARVPRAAELLS